MPGNRRPAETGRASIQRGSSIVGLPVRARPPLPTEDNSFEDLEGLTELFNLEAPSSATPDFRPQLPFDSIGGTEGAEFIGADGAAQPPQPGLVQTGGLVSDGPNLIISRATPTRLVQAKLAELVQRGRRAINLIDDESVRTFNAADLVRGRLDFLAVPAMEVIGRDALPDLAPTLARRLQDLGV